VIVGDHDRVGHGLGDDFISIIFDGEDDLEAHLFILMSTIAGYAHGKFDLNGSCGRLAIRPFDRAGCILRGSINPFLDLICVENDHSPFFIPLKHFLFLRLLLFLSRRPFSFALYTASTNADLPSIQRLVLIVF